MQLNRKSMKDERAIHFENISYKLGYNFISFILLIDVVYRALVLNEAAWDLLGIIISSGLVMTIYHFKKKIIDVSCKKNLLISTGITFIIAFLIIVIFKVM